MAIEVVQGLGTVAADRGNLKIALVYYRAALAIEQRLAPRSLDVATSLSVIARIYADQGDLDAAVQFRRDALAIQKERAPGSLAVAKSLADLGAAVFGRGDAETAVKEIAGTAQDAHVMLNKLQPDLEAMARNGTRISVETRELVAKINDGQGTVGKLVNDDELYRQLEDVSKQAHDVMDNLHQVSDEARRAVVDFRSKDGPAQGLLADMRTTIGQAREATADLADNMEAMKHNFLLRGFFNKRGYYDLDSISPVEYRTGVLENGKRKAMRIWLKSSLLFEPGPDRR